MGTVDARKPHVVMLPFPAQGHISPMMQLAKLMHSTGFHVTFVNTEFNHRRLIRSKGPDSVKGLPDFRFETIPDGLPPSDRDATQDPPPLCDSTRKNCLVPFKELLVKLNSSSENPAVTLVVSDGVMSFAIKAAEDLGIPEVQFWSASACSFLGYLSYRELVNRGIFPFKDENFSSDGTLETPIDWIPGMRNICLKDLPSFLRTTDPNDIMFDFLGEEAQNCLKAPFIIFNTFDAFEQEALEAITFKFPQIYTIGPLSLLGKHVKESQAKSLQSSLWKEDSKCIQWLDQREPNSVVYVNYGSVTTMTDQHFKEFAWGLANSQKPFLWIVRADVVMGDSAILPEEFFDEIKNRGLIASWCQQDQVLSHPSVMTFLTHCGWNSMLESVCGGVPVICWPFFADQQTNCHYSCAKWGIGMEVNHNVKQTSMKQIRRCTRILILSSLAVSMFIPIFLLSDRLKNLTSDASKVFIEDLSSIKYRTEILKHNAIKQEEGQSLKEPALVVYKDGDFGSRVRYFQSESGDVNASGIMVEKNGTNQIAEEDNHKNQQRIPASTYGEKEKSKHTKDRPEENVQSHSQRVIDEKVKQMKDQVIRAKAYLKFAPPNSNSQLVRELKLRIREVEHAVGDSTKDSDLSKSDLQKMRSMEASLLKASHVYPDCSAMATKLRAMTYNAEEQVRAQKNQAAFLVRLAGRTTPKGLHCLSMRLTAEYFSLHSKEQELPNQHKLLDPDLYHFAVFSDNVLACSVVVNSTISSIMEPEKVVFHVVTDSLNFPAITMWFLLNPPAKATIQVQSIDTFEWVSSKFGALLGNQKSRDPRYTSSLNHLRFYLPDVFPALSKILFLDHDVVVQRDLTGLWNVDMKGQVNGAVETCRESDPSFCKMGMFINFSDPMVAKRFDAKVCTWAFGMNMFDLQQWRRRNLTGLYRKYLLLGNQRPLWKAGSLPLGWVTFYNQTVALDRRWHVLGLGYDLSVSRGDIELAAVIHYDGMMKPWLDIGIEKYRNFWRKRVNYDHPYLQQCNIHR